MTKTYLSHDVFQAVQSRLEIIFRDFDNVLVAFSAGKDSGVLLNLAYDYAKKHNLMHKLAYYYMDYEAGYKYCHEYADRTFKNLDGCRRYWLCLPIKAACAVSMHQTSWIPWNPDEQEIWVRPMPEGDYVVNLKNCPFPFTKGEKGFDVRINFAKWFGATQGKTAVLVGLRADESLSRQAVITSQHRKEMHQNIRYSKTVDACTTNFYPIYDWTAEDVWTANGKQGWDYNKIYDRFYQAGLSLAQMRIASPFHQCGQENLKFFRAIDPESWGLMVSRVNGVNFCGIYGGTTAMGWRTIKKPAHFTWKEYAQWLLDTLPDETKKTILYHLKRIQKEWEGKGHGRNPRVIAQMEKEGIELEKTGEHDKRNTKPGFYEIVKIKSGIPDETAIPMFRKCPSWKGVCITILKNDFTCQYMGIGRSKKTIEQRNAMLAKYKNL
jgi:predicted phosphoadenosine phosphosulfate sulfurtransferase